ncbi:hypothetical protein HK100_006836 [Physocladia obscura]|uniref:Kinesin motor domain-containing protein n=1 Tax=Physocladia obscura TaxID=109957 RepID=A0AAD5SS56_9FUNG|nr:hypothetical protein HK100_006836 [Physocladia obscura]
MAQQHDLSWFEDKALSQREFIEKEMAKFTRTIMKESPETSPQEVEANVEDDDRDVVICVRARPVLPAELERGIFPAILTTDGGVTTEAKVYVHSLEYKLNGLPKVTTKDFGVDYAFDETASNDQVYNKTAKKLIPIALGGGVGSLFASGQTGSGKTHTMTAIENLIARDLFQSAQEYRQNQNGIPADQVSDSADFEFRVCFFEILGNKCYDLLEYPNEVTIMEDVLGQIQVNGVHEEQVHNPDQLMKIIARGAEHRKTAATYKNDTSSRSHAVCRIRIKNLRQLEAEEGLLYLLDLAGSESAADSKHHDKERAKEKLDINKSLATLKDCIRNRALAVLSTKHVHVPYRNSRLTLLLKTAFELSSTRACRTVVIATLNPSVLDTGHSLNTLRYISPLKVEIPVTSESTSPEDPTSWSNTKLKEWVNEHSEVINAEILCPTESGKQLLKLPESTFIDRCVKCGPTVTPKIAKAFYNKFWRLVVDARTKIRQDKDLAILRNIAERRRDGQEHLKSVQNDPEAKKRMEKERERHQEWLKRMVDEDPEKLAQWVESQRIAAEIEATAGDGMSPEEYSLWLETNKEVAEYRQARLKEIDEWIDKALEGRDDISVGGRAIFAALRSMK